MRTTIEISQDFHQKLSLEAALRHKKGFSSLIEEALEQYFQSSHQKRKELVKKLKGCLSAQEYTQEMERLREGRGQWRES